MIFYDTCSLLDNFETLDDESYVIISSITLEELEKIKTSTIKSEDIKFLARQALHYVDTHGDKIDIYMYNTSLLEPFTKRGFEVNNDLKILACAYAFYSNLSNDYGKPQFTFITNDLALKMIAKIYVPTKSKYPEKDTYCGFKEIIMNENTMAEFYSHPTDNQFNILINEYLIVKDEKNNIVDTVCWTGKEYRPLSFDTFNSKWFGKVKPFKGDIYQQLVADSFEHNKLTLVKGPAGSGKAQPNSTLIPTKKGYIKLGDIKIGDKILDRLGNETTVLAVYPQGLKENYQITFSDGRIAYCNDEHLWSCYTSKGNLKDFTVKEMLTKGLQQKCGDWKYKIPINKAVEYPEQEYDIDPYVLGVFLGDGCCKEKPLTLSSQDEEIVAEVAKLIGAKKYLRGSEHNYNWYFYLPEVKIDNSSNFGETPIFRYQTKQFFINYSNNLICSAQEKSIPNNYKFGSINQRYSLLQGLMDTDGTIDNEKKGRTRFTSISYQLVKDVQEICWSLGISASISEDNRINKYTTDKCYTLTISCSKDKKPNLFRLKRKKDIAIGYANNNIKSTYSETLTIKKIEKMSRLEEMTCILVDNPEHLYLTEQYIVTHNTFLSLGYLMSQLDKGRIDKIIVFCNTVATKNSAKLGYLPGTRDEKLLDSQIGNVLASKFGNRLELERLIEEEKIVLLPFSDLRGYDTSGMSAGIYISEAQNLDITLMKLALQRIGEDSICIIDGDEKTQVDDIAFAGRNNGMRRVSKIFRGHDIYGEIELQNIHRSKIANIAELM